MAEDLKHTHVALYCICLLMSLTTLLYVIMSLRQQPLEGSHVAGIIEGVFVHKTFTTVGGEATVANVMGQSSPVGKTLLVEYENKVAVDQQVNNMTAKEIHVTTTPVTEPSSNSNPTNIPSVAGLYRRLVCVTAISDSHFEESKAMFASVQHCLPHKKIIVYDLGLNSTHRDHVSNYTNVELRPFPFNDYLPYVRNLNLYAWKPIIVKLVSQEYDVIMYGDSSLRMISCNINPALAHLLKFPFLDLRPMFHHIIEFTHDGMIDYLHYPGETWQEYRHFRVVAG